ncbi:hypothetical protein BV25DRAFT_1840660 [Artomyces pyxidatus]|uniref:Uncharacterized protein n=1 Tax=Artomyces pyxidatus TaxID=48021 RepID=A0ACB8SRM0_9AGAM|nr:hypothetical protein BV25DRAFT_1840660 [Artomyces pyxidatus]
MQSIGGILNEDTSSNLQVCCQREHRATVKPGKFASPVWRTVAAGPRNLDKGFRKDIYLVMVIATVTCSTTTYSTSMMQNMGIVAMAARLAGARRASHGRLRPPYPALQSFDRTGRLSDGSAHEVVAKRLAVCQSAGFGALGCEAKHAEGGPDSEAPESGEAEAMRKSAGEGWFGRRSSIGGAERRAARVRPILPEAALRAATNEDSQPTTQTLWRVCPTRPVREVGSKRGGWCGRVEAPPPRALCGASGSISSSSSAGQSPQLRRCGACARRAPSEKWGFGRSGGWLRPHRRLAARHSPVRAELLKQDFCAPPRGGFEVRQLRRRALESCPLLSFGGGQLGISARWSKGPALRCSGKVGSCSWKSALRLADRIDGRRGDAGLKRALSVRHKEI